MVIAHSLYLDSALGGRTGRALIHVLLRRRGLTPAFVPPISVVFARARDHYVGGLEVFREDRVPDWVESFAESVLQAASLATRYVDRVRELQEEWRERLRTAVDPRSDAAAWALIDVLPAHPVITVPVGVAATGRTKPAVTNGIDQLVAAGVLAPLGESKRNRAWEAEGLLDLVEAFEAGEDDPPADEDDRLRLGRRAASGTPRHDGTAALTCGDADRRVSHAAGSSQLESRLHYVEYSGSCRRPRPSARRSPC